MRNDLSFASLVLSVQDFVWDARLGKEGGNLKVRFNGDGADKDWLSFGVSFFDSLDKSFELSLVGGEDKIVIIDTLNWTVGWDADDLQVVDGLELFFLGLGSTGHTGELLVETGSCLER